MTQPTHGLVSENGFKPTRIPLLINGVSVFNESNTEKHSPIPNGHFQGANLADCAEALSSSSEAFLQWSTTPPTTRRALLLRLAEILKERQDEANNIIKTEIHCGDDWATENVSSSIKLIQESAYLLTSRSMNGTIPYTEAEGSYGFVFPRPLGVVLGIAPWNAPLILGFRAVVAPVAAGNTAILKGSELSPRTHHFIAELFVAAGFPPGVVNFILHRPEDASEVVTTLIKHPAVRKINFTGSTEVGRIIAQEASKVLKPVLLELGGKNCSIVLNDGDVARAAEAVLLSATLNGGQICMSTDLAVVVQGVAENFKAKLRQLLADRAGESFQLVGPKGAARTRALVADAEAKGAKSRSSTQTLDTKMVSVTILEDIDPSMDFFRVESFGPCVGVVVVPDENEAIKVANSSDYGLSAAIWTKDHYKALEMARKLQVGAVHINSLTVHDEATLPHGGTKCSGFGRFGAEWGLAEFVETQTVIINP
ncbi:Aldedh domain-containing protein [Fusarium keratoplasticum]|nr:Aldedh domain-containing protein [Fusarium keratoplasticum]